jgi:hypothetical protein
MRGYTELDEKQCKYKYYGTTKHFPKPPLNKINDLRFEGWGFENG